MYKLKVKEIQEDKLEEYSWQQVQQWLAAQSGKIDVL
jgi:hypothetical protein